MDSPPTFDPATGVIGFSVTVAGKVIACRVTEDWLCEAYGSEALEDGAMTAFAKRRADVDAAALRSWLASRGAEPVWLKRAQVWRQPSRGAGERQAPEKHPH